VTFYTDAGQELECGQLPNKSHHTPGYGKGTKYSRDGHITSSADDSAAADATTNGTAVQSSNVSRNATATGTARHTPRKPHKGHNTGHHDDSKLGKAVSRTLLEAEAVDRKKHGTYRAAHVSETEMMLPSFDSLDALLYDARPSGDGNSGVLETKRRYYNPSMKPSGRTYYGQPKQTTLAAGPTKCSVDRAPRQPEWSVVPHWWTLKASDRKPFGMAGGR
jgi:hypothetical protein